MTTQKSYIAELEKEIDTLEENLNEVVADDQAILNELNSFTKYLNSSKFYIDTTIQTWEIHELISRIRKIINYGA